MCGSSFLSYTAEREFEITFISLFSRHVFHAFFFVSVFGGSSFDIFLVYIGNNSLFDLLVFGGWVDILHFGSVGGGD